MGRTGASSLVVHGATADRRPPVVDATVVPHRHHRADLVERRFGAVGQIPATYLADVIEDLACSLGPGVVRIRTPAWHPRRKDALASRLPSHTMLDVVVTSDGRRS